MKIMIVDESGDVWIRDDQAFKIWSVMYGDAWYVDFCQDEQPDITIASEMTQGEAEDLRDALALQYVKAVKAGDLICLLSASDPNLNPEFKNEENPRGETQGNQNTGFKLSGLESFRAPEPQCVYCGSNNVERDEHGWWCDDCGSLTTYMLQGGTSGEH